MNSSKTNIDKIGTTSLPFFPSNNRKLSNFLNKQRQNPFTKALLEINSHNSEISSKPCTLLSYQSRSRQLLKRNSQNIDHSNILQEMKTTRQCILSVNKSENDLNNKILFQVGENIKKRSLKKDNMRNFIQEKRDMFLVKMKIQEKQSQMKIFEEKTADKIFKLKKIETKVAEDLNQFNQYLENDKELTKNVVKETEIEIKDRMLVGARVKELKEFKIANLNVSAKMFERLNNLFCFKLFLDRLSPSSFHDNNTKKKLSPEKLKEVSEKGEQSIEEKQNLFDKKKASNNFSHKSFLKKRNIGGKSQIFSSFIKNNQPNDENEINDCSNPQKDQNLDQVNNNRRNDEMSVSPAHFNDKNLDFVNYSLEMMQKLRFDISPEIRLFMKEPTTKCIMFFKSQNDLIEVYKQIEEENISYIKSTLNLKTKFEEKENLFSEMKLNYNIERTKLIRKKEEFIRKIEKMSEKLIPKANDQDLEKSKVNRYIQSVCEGINKLADILKLPHTNGLVECLTRIEICMTNDIQKISRIDSTLMKKLEKILNDEKKMVFAASLMEKEKEIRYQKMEKLKKKVFSVKKGRLTQYRSFLKADSRKSLVQSNNDDAESDII